MSTWTRRRFLQTAGLGAVVAGVAPTTALRADAQEGDELFELLRRQHAQRLDAIKTLRATWEVRLDYLSPTYEAAQEEDLRAQTEGLVDVYYDSGKYRFVYRLASFSREEILANGRYLSRITHENGQPTNRVLYDGPSGTRRRPGISIEDLFPGLEDRPSHYEGIRSLDGEPHHVFMQGDRRYWYSKATGELSQVDLFDSARHVGKTFRCLELTEVSPEMLFPVTTVTEHFSMDDELTLRITMRMIEVAVNEIPDPSNFDIRRP